PEGDLEFRAESGRIELSARDDVRIHSDRTVEVHGDGAVSVANRGSESQPGSRMTMDARGMNVATPSLDARANQARGSFGETRLITHTLVTAVETAKHVVGVL